jgi:hypothetical protein
LVVCVWGYGPRYSLNIHTSWGFLFELGDISQGLLEKNILNFYRLEDVDGTQITLEQLADRYFLGIPKLH